MRYQQSDTSIDTRPDMRLQLLITWPQWRIRKARFCPDAELIPIEFLVTGHSGDHEIWCHWPVSPLASVSLSDHVPHLTICEHLICLKLPSLLADGELSLDGVKWLVSEASSDCDRSSEPDPGPEISIARRANVQPRTGQIKFPSQGWFEYYNIQLGENCRVTEC